MSSSWQISRRSFIRSSFGVALALPILEVMAQKEAALPCRMAVIKTPIGKNMDTWTPKKTGPDYALPST